MKKFQTVPVVLVAFAALMVGAGCATGGGTSRATEAGAKAAWKAAQAARARAMSVNAQELAAESFASGENRFERGEVSRKKKNWSDAVDQHKRAKFAFDRSYNEAQSQGKKMVKEGSKMKSALPKRYVVRSPHGGRHDSLWRIAEYDFVYGDPFKWKKLYRANEKTMPQRGNPDLIYPGQVVEIPSITGEERDGTWRDGMTEPDR